MAEELAEFHPGYWPEIPMQVQIVIGAYIPGKGWLTTKRSIIYGGHHGPAPLIDDDEDTVVDILMLEVRGGVRAMQHKLRHG